MPQKIENRWSVRAADGFQGPRADVIQKLAATDLPQWFRDNIVALITAAQPGGVKVDAHAAAIGSTITSQITVTGMVLAG